MKKKILIITSILVLVFAFSAQVFAATRTYSRSWTIYNAPSGNYPFAICVGKMTMFAEGDDSLGRVYNVYTTRSTKLGGYFTDTSTWIAVYPGYERAWCTSTYNFGIPTPWGPLGYQKGFELTRRFG